MTGQRRHDASPHLFEPGDYGRWDGKWYGMTSVGLAGLANHEVVEHEDGTITVSPSILCSTGEQSWHGYLERGIWREC